MAMTDHKEQFVVQALADLVRAISNMRVPQNIAEAALQVGITIGPALEQARKALDNYSIKDDDRATLRYIDGALYVFDGTSQTFDPIITEQPIAWAFELAKTVGHNDDGTVKYSNFEWCLSRDKPNVPAGSIRNLMPLKSMTGCRP